MRTYTPVRYNLMMCAEMATEGGAKKKGKKKEGESKYGRTVLLPSTAFDQRANSLVRLGTVMRRNYTHGVIMTYHDHRDFNFFC